LHIHLLLFASFLTHRYKDDLIFTYLSAHLLSQAQLFRFVASGIAGHGFSIAVIQL